MRGHTLGRNHINVSSVVRLSMTKEDFQFMRGHTLGRNHIYAMSVVNFSQIFVILHTMCVVNLSQKLVNLFFNFIHNFVQISIICALICSQKWPIWQPWAINNLLAVTVRLFTDGGCHSLLWPNEFFSHIVWNGQFLTMCWRANAYISAHKS